MPKDKLLPKTRLRDSRGRFVSRLYVDKVKQIIDLGKYKNDPRPLQEIYNELGSIERSLQSKPFRTANALQSSTIFQQMHETRGKLFLNGKEVKEGIIRQRVLEFQQRLFTEFDCTGIAYRPLIDHLGNYYMELPEREEIEMFEEMEGEEIMSYLENFGIDVWLSDPAKSKNPDRAKSTNQRLRDKNKQALKNTKDANRAAKGKSNKGGIRSKGNKKNN